MKNYDISHRWGFHVVKVTFQQWEYKTTVTTKVGGNCKGMTILETAIGNIYEQMGDQGDPDTICLKSPNGDTLYCTDDEQRGEEWLKDMVVAVTVTDFVPEARAQSEVVTLAL
jgi:hypothetical protein